MAFNFTPETPVLHFGPRHHTRWSLREFVLWPAWAYRVVAPRRKSRNLNILQRAVLGLGRAGILTAEEHATYLDIHKDLAALIMIELSGRGFLDNRMCPTKEGLQALNEESMENQELVAGHVFQDPWTGDLWPRFVERLDYCELERNEKGFPVLMLGTSGKPRRQSAFTVLPTNVETPSTPLPVSIVDAVDRHHRAMKYKQHGSDGDDTDDPDTFIPSATQIHRVSFIEPEPQPVFLTTYMYIPESENEAIDWFACDPFGFGSSSGLRRSMESVTQKHRGLYEVVNRLVGRSLFEGYEDQRRWYDLLKLTAEKELEERFTVDIRTHKIFNQLLELEAAWQEILAIGEGCPTRKINEVLRGGVKVLEAGFAAMAGDYPLKGIWERVYAKRIDAKTGKNKLVPQLNRSIVAATVVGATSSIGFQVPPPKSLTNVNPGQIRFAADNAESWRLRPTIVATLLAAEKDPSHPLRDIAASCPSFLESVEEVANLGGKAGHAHETSETIEDARRQVESVYSLAALMLGMKNIEVAVELK